MFEENPDHARLMNALSGKVYAPVPWRWLNVGAVLDQVVAWLKHSEAWVDQSRKWSSGGDRWKEMRALEDLEKYWPPNQATVSWTHDYEHELVSFEQLQQHKANGAKYQAYYRAGPPTPPPGPFWSVLTPQGPIVVAAPETWPASLDGGLVLMDRMGWEGQAGRSSLVEVLQIEPMEDSLVKDWVPWASRNGDLYLATTPIP